MSSRHVWEKYNWQYKETRSSVSEGWFQGTNAHNLVYSSTYSFEASATTTGRIYKLGSSYTTRDLDDYSYVDIPAGRYFKFCTSSIVLNSDNIFYSGNGCRVTRDTSSSTLGTNKITNVSETKKLGYSYATTDLVEKFATNSSSSYSKNTVTSGYYYKYLGADSIDPKNVVYSGEVSAGENVTISVTPNDNTYGGTISYLYEYSIDQGVSWVSAGTTTATTIDVAIPIDAASFQARVKASDNMSFASDTYVYGENVGVASKGLFVTNDGVQRELTAIHAMVDGVQCELTSLLATVDGVAREIFGKAAGSVLPVGYTPLEYIESTGTQYIDTGFKPNNDTRVVMCSRITTKPSSSACLFGSRKASGSIDNSLWYVASSNNFQSGYGNAKLTATAPDILAKRVYDKDKNKFYVDGELLITNTAATFQTSWTLFLMENNQNGSAQGNKCAMKLYYCQIYDAGVLIRDYVPCKNEIGAVGLYDLVYGEFYPNAGNGVFAAGYTGEAKSVEMTNLAPQLSVSGNWNAGTVDSSHKASSGESYRAITATASVVEKYIASSTTVPLNSSHVYYARFEVMQEKKVGAMSLYWPIAEPVFFANATTVAGVTTCSAVNNRSGHASGNYQMRIDFDNDSVAGTAYVGDLIVVDLTAAFGSGNEPDKAWCDAKIPYFVGTATVSYTT